jgi:hypothetical protein
VTLSWVVENISSDVTCPYWGLLQDFLGHKDVQLKEHEDAWPKLVERGFSVCLFEQLTCSRTSCKAYFDTIYKY